MLIASLLLACHLVTSFWKVKCYKQEAITKIVVEKSRLAKLCETERAVAVRQRSKNEKIEKRK